VNATRSASSPARPDPRDVRDMRGVRDSRDSRDSRGVRRVRRVRGTTLFELLVVLVIMGIMVGMMAVSADQNGTIALDQATVVVQDTCARAQALARSGRAPVGVVFDVAGNRLAIVREDGTLTKDPLTHADAVVNFKAPNMPSHVALKTAAFGAAGVAAIFDAQGVPLLGGTVTMQRKGLTRTLTLNAATGELTGS